MDYEATIKVTKNPDVVFDCFSPEKKPKSDRADYTIRKEKGAVIVEVKASDSVSFRATMASIEKMLAVIEKTSKT